MSIGNRSRGTFRMVPDALWAHPQVDPIDIKVWCVLCQHARDRGELTSTNRAIAESAGISDRTVKRSLARLSGLGFVKMEGETIHRTIFLQPDALEPTYALKIAN